MESSGGVCLPVRRLAMENSGGVLARAEVSDGEQQRRALPSGIQESMGAGSRRHVQLGERAVCEVYVGIVQCQSLLLYGRFVIRS
jgi:hypothetical protein